MRLKTCVYFLAFIICILNMEVQSMKRSKQTNQDNTDGSSSSFSLPNLPLSAPVPLACEKNDKKRKTLTHEWLESKRQELFNGFTPYIALKDIKSDTDQESAMALMGEIAFQQLPNALKQAQETLIQDNSFQELDLDQNFHHAYLKDENGNFIESIDQRVGQSREQAVLGWMFYPPPLRKEPQRAEDLYHQAGILYQLGASATYNNIEALSHLGKFAQPYLESQPSKKVKKASQKNSLQTLLSRSQEILANVSNDEQESDFLRGMAAYLQEDYEKAKEHFLNDTLQSSLADPRSFYHLGLMMKREQIHPLQQDKASLFQQSADKGYIPAQFELALLESDPVERLKKVYNLGKDAQYPPALGYIVRWTESSNPNVQNYLKTLNINELREDLRKKGYRLAAKQGQEAQSKFFTRSTEAAQNDADTILSMIDTLAEEKTNEGGVSPQKSLSSKTKTKSPKSKVKKKGARK